MMRAFPSALKCWLDRSRFTQGRFITAAGNFAATAFSSRQSRFFEKVE